MLHFSFDEDFISENILDDVKLPNESNKNVLQGRLLLTLVTCNSPSAIAFSTKKK